jgi:DNA-binding CsgD family transcriptional regulator
MSINLHGFLKINLCTFVQLSAQIGSGTLNCYEFQVVKPMLKIGSQPSFTTSTPIKSGTMTLTQKFKEYCKHNITNVVQPLSDADKKELVKALNHSPFKSIVQAYSVLDFYDYKHLHTEGFDTYFGYRNNEITAETILEIVHPDDQEAFGTLYYLCLEGLMNMPFPTKNIGHFCINYRVKDKYGAYHRVLETNNIIACDEQTFRPIVNLAQMTVLPATSESHQVKYYFKMRDENNSVAIMQEYLSRYDNKVNIFTQNELKIARLLKNGLTSQAIAGALFLSKHTVDKYRKNMLAKTQTSNTPQLLTYLQSIGVL